MARHRRKMIKRCMYFIQPYKIHILIGRMERFCVKLHYLELSVLFYDLQRYFWSFMPKGSVFPSILVSEKKHCSDHNFKHSMFTILSKAIFVRPRYVKIWPIPLFKTSLLLVSVSPQKPFCCLLPVHWNEQGIENNLPITLLWLQHVGLPCIV